MLLRQMPWAKKGTHLESCAIADSTRLPMHATEGSAMRASNHLEENMDYLKKLQAMSELQRAMLMQLIPLAPRAMHSAVLLEAVTPFLKGRNKKERRREFEAAVDPLVQDGLVKYFCCMIDSYAINPRHLSIARYLVHQKPDE
jgi:hypothetical protein